MLIEEAWQLLSKLPTLETDFKEALANSFRQLEWVTTQVTKFIRSWFEVSSVGDSILVLNECFQVTAEKMGMETNVLNFPHLSLKSMKTLQDLGKTNTIYNLSKVVGEPRPDGSGTLIPLKRMPFGMVQYIIDFFASNNVMQVSTITCNLQGQNTRTKNPSKSLNTVRDIKRTRRKVKEVTSTDLLNPRSMFLAQRSQLDTEVSTGRLTRQKVLKL